MTSINPSAEPPAQQPEAHHRDSVKPVVATSAHSEGNRATAAIDASFSVRAGEFTMNVDLKAQRGITVLFGPSGAGKSLTLATLAGLRRPDKGTVSINGQLVADASTGFHTRTQDRRLGVVFQDSLLLPHRTVRDNVALAVRAGLQTADRSGSRNETRAGTGTAAGRGAGTRAERRRLADELLERVGATKLADAAPRRLSGGERQRVALARALAGNPHALLLDEPFSALDYSTRQTLRELLRSLVDTTGIPTLLVTHDLDEAAQLADQTVMYLDGSTSAAQPGFPIQLPPPSANR
jgi:molybdate transport system ATP-binding protein